MICPKCVELGFKSCVTVGNTFSTAMHCVPYYDEEGKFHRHDTNNVSRTYTCSNGHAIKEVLGRSCESCDFQIEGSFTVI